MFTYFNPLTVNLTKNSKLEKFVHELNALWKLSGSSMGALRELVAVAGILLTLLLYNCHYDILILIVGCVVSIFCCHETEQQNIHILNILFRFLLTAIL